LICTDFTENLYRAYPVNNNTLTKEKRIPAAGSLPMLENAPFLKNRKNRFVNRFVIGAYAVHSP
jgi:hypothetical protein